MKTSNVIALAVGIPAAIIGFRAIQFYIEYKARSPKTPSSMYDYEYLNQMDLELRRKYPYLYDIGTILGMKSISSHRKSV